MTEQVEVDQVVVADYDAYQNAEPEAVHYVDEPRSVELTIAKIDPCQFLRLHSCCRSPSASQLLWESLWCGSSSTV